MTRYYKLGPSGNEPSDVSVEVLKCYEAAKAKILASGAPYVEMNQAIEETVKEWNHRLQLGQNGHPAFSHVPVLHAKRVQKSVNNINHVGSDIRHIIDHKAYRSRRRYTKVCRKFDSIAWTRLSMQAQARQVANILQELEKYELQGYLPLELKIPSQEMIERKTGRMEPDYFYLEKATWLSFEEVIRAYEYRELLSREDQEVIKLLKKPVHAGLAAGAAVAQHIFQFFVGRRAA